MLVAGTRHLSAQYAIQVAVYPSSSQELCLTYRNIFLSLMFCHDNLRRFEMGTCATCGNDYDKSFEVIRDGDTFTFDSFECAIQKLAPSCHHCGCKIIGHGLEDDGTYYCCAHCAEIGGSTALRDRV